jgi:hypothetical protein
MLEKYGLTDEEFVAINRYVNRFEGIERIDAYLSLFELKIVGYDEMGCPQFKSVLHVPDIELSSNP